MCPHTELRCRCAILDGCSWAHVISHYMQFWFCVKREREARRPCIYIYRCNLMKFTDILCPSREWGRVKSEISPPPSAPSSTEALTDCQWIHAAQERERVESSSCACVGPGGWHEQVPRKDILERACCPNSENFKFFLFFFLNLFIFFLYIYVWCCEQLTRKYSRVFSRLFFCLIFSLFFTFLYRVQTGLRFVLRAQKESGQYTIGK